MADCTTGTSSSETSTFPMLSYNFGDPYRAEMAIREETLKKSRRPGFTLSPNAFFPHSIDMTALNESLLMNEKEMSMLEDIFVPKEIPKPSYPFTPPDFKDDYEDIDTSFNVDLTPEVIEAQKAVVFKPEPWTDVVCEDSCPTNLIYEKTSQEELSNEPFIDPIKVSYEPLQPTIVNDLLVRPNPRTLGLQNIKASKKEITFPDHLTYDYLLALHQFEEEDTKEDPLSKNLEETHKKNNEAFQSESRIDVNQSDVKNLDSDSSDVEEVDSIIHATGRLSVDEGQHTQADFTQVKEEFVENSNMVFLSVTLSGCSADVYHLLRVFLISTWETLMSVQVSPVSQWTSQFDNPLQLSPSVTAHWINLLKNEIWEKGFSNVTDEIAELQTCLICLHGATVTFDTFVNLDFELAQEHAKDFFRKFALTLPGNFRELLESFDRLNPQCVKVVHPKLTKLVERLLEHFETIEVHGVIWICLHRHSTEIASLIYEHLGEAGIDCTVDPIIFRPKKEKIFQVRSTPPIIIAEVMPKEFPASKISLIVHYEPPPGEWRGANKKYNSVAQEAMITCLPCVETDDVEIVAPQSSPFNDSCSSGSPTIPLPSQIDPAIVITLDEVENTTPNEIANDPGSPCCGLQGATANPFVTQPNYTCSIIIASRLKRNGDFMEALNSVGDIQVRDYDYSFLKEFAMYQPDILLSIEAAVLIYQPEADESFSELRMKLLSMSLKCTKCWVIVLCPGCRVSGKLPPDWHSLNSLAHYHAHRMLKSEIDLRFAVIPSLAFNYGQLASIVKDVAMNEAAGDVNLPIGHEIQRLLCVPQLNAISAHLIAQIVSSADFFSLPLKELLEKLMQSLSENICLRIIAFHESSQFDRTQKITDDKLVEPSASFGKICKNLESFSSPRIGSSLRKLGQLGPDSIDKLKEIWSSDHQSQ